MKLLYTLLIASFLGTTSVAQTCKSYFLMKNGSTSELTQYDKKDKVESKIEYEVVHSTGSASEIRMKLYDKKDKLINSNDFEVKCENNTFHLDMESIIPAEQLASFSSMEIDVSSSFLEFPASLEVGTKLPDGKITIDISSSGVKIMSMEVVVKNRKVEAKEEVTTPAGTFMCYKLSDETFVKTGFANITTKSINWISENIGTVKSESYDEKGKYTGKTVLTKLSTK